MTTSTAIFVLLTTLCFVTSIPLPKYIKPCKVDKNLNSCAVRNGNQAWSSIVKGDPKYKIPPLDPFDVTRIKTTSGSGRNLLLTLGFTNVKLHGIRGMKITGARLDLKKHHIEYDLFIPSWRIAGDYKMEGRFLLLPINGIGKANITLVNVTVVAKIDYTVVKEKGVELMKIGKADLSSYDMARMYAKFENLFNGNRALIFSVGDNMNQVIDDNWKEFNKELGPSFAEALGQVFKTVLVAVVGLVPYKEIFIF